PKNTAGPLQRVDLTPPLRRAFPASPHHLTRLKLSYMPIEAVERYEHGTGIDDLRGQVTDLLINDQAGSFHEEDRSSSAPVDRHIRAIRTCCRSPARES